MVSQRKDLPAESTSDTSEVLSEATDLHALMEAILGDRIGPPDSVGAPSAVPAGPEPAVAPLPPPTPVASTQPARYPTESVIGAAIPDDVNTWGFTAEEDAGETAAETALVREPGRDLRVPVTAPRTWRDRLRGSISKQWTIVAGLLAAALITVSAISLRGEATQTTGRSLGELGVMRSRPPVQHSSAAARISSEGEIRPPTITSDDVQVTEAPRANKRPPRATGERSASISVKRRDITAPLTWPIVMSPDTLEEVAEAAEDISTPAQLLSGGAPDYPAALRTAGIGGSVEVRFTIASNGEVLDARATTGPPQLRSIAEAAVRRWRYQAARVGKRAVEMQTSVSFYFDPAAQIARQ